MFDFFGAFQSLVELGLLIAMAGIKIFALVDAARHRPDAYPAAGKRTKNLWLIILGVTLAVQVVIRPPLNFLNIIGAVAAIIYLVDVRPALRQVGGRGGNSGRMGPYGPW